MLFPLLLVKGHFRRRESQPWVVSVRFKATRRVRRSQGVSLLVP